MSEVLGFESAKLLVRRGWIAPTKSAGFLLVLGASVLLLTVFVSAQSPSSPQTRKTPPGGSNPSTTEPAGPPPGQIWLPPLQAPSHAPVIAWDGKLLTIDAENSSLADILLAIRSHTGASIEMPGSTNRERIAIHLGPAPVREVISSLLYGTDFNYVIQSSEDDQTALGKVIITSRDGDDSEDIVTADAGSNPSTPLKPKMRLMPGYAAPGKRDFEVALSNKIEESSSSSVAEMPAADYSAPVEEQPSVAAGTDSNTTKPQTDTHPVASADATNSSSSSDSATLTAAESVTAAAETVPAGSSDASSEGDPSSTSHMEQTLQKMYQQRQQLQAQQNRATQSPTR